MYDLQHVYSRFFGTTIERVRAEIVLWLGTEINYLLNRITYLRLVYNRTLKQLSKGAAVFSVAERFFKQQSNTVSCCAM